jgi:hypothetical protein
MSNLSSRESSHLPKPQYKMQKIQQETESIPKENSNLLKTIKRERIKD